MKKLLLVFLPLLCLTINAQTFTQSNHAPNAGFIYTTNDCDTVGIKPGASGTGALWNFTSLITAPTITTSNTFTTSVNTNTVDYPSANLYTNSSSNSSYSESKNTELNLHGFSATVNGINGDFYYSDPAKIMLYPFNYSNTSNDATQGNTNPAGTFTGNCNVVFDGAGTLGLPNRIFNNVSRIHTVQTYTYSAPSFWNGDVKTETYDYYSLTDSRVPIFSISTTTLNHTQIAVSPTVITNQVQKFVTVQKNYEVVGIKENTTPKIEVVVYPNPATNYINFNTESKEVALIQILDVTGKLIDKQVFSNNNFSINTSHYTAGIYLYSIFDKQNRLLKTGKFNVEK